jgi:glycosyltransferase involved in cell wall biosynthesis
MFDNMKDDRPLVSIFCATYNHENYISDAIEGFLSQITDFKFEVIICEDNSTDNTAEIIKIYEKENPKLIKVFYHKENLHSQKIDFFQTEFLPTAQGKYIAFCEGDDYWTDPLKLQKQVDYLESNQHCSCLFTNCEWKYENGQIISHDFAISNLKGLSHREQKKSISKSTKWLPILTMMFRNDIQFIIAFGKIHKKASKFQVRNGVQLPGDFLLILALLEIGKLALIPDITAIYNINSQGMSRGYMRKYPKLISLGTTSIMLSWSIKQFLFKEALLHWLSIRLLHNNNFKGSTRVKNWIRNQRVNQFLLINTLIFL